VSKLAIAAAVLGAQYLIESNGGWPAILGLLRGASSSSPGDGTIAAGATPNVSQPGNTAAVAYLMGLGSIAGITVPAIDTRNANNGSVSAIWSSIHESVTSSTDGRALATAFLHAYDAARKADPINYTPFVTTSGDDWLQSQLFILAPCDASTGFEKNSLGQAGCALAQARDAYGSGNSWLQAFGVSASDTGTIDNAQIIDAIATLASEMDAVGFLTKGDAPIDQTASLGQIAGGVQYAISKSTQAVVGGALDALEGVIGPAVTGAISSVLGSNLVWAAAFGLVAWKVLR
jgi:hypothetical protein